MSSWEIVLRFEVDMFARSFESMRSTKDDAATTEVSFEPIRICSSSRPCLKRRWRS